jgi:hypothetical protein
MKNTRKRKIRFAVVTVNLGYTMIIFDTIYQTNLFFKF